MGELAHRTGASLEVLIEQRALIGTLNACKSFAAKLVNAADLERIDILLALVVARSGGDIVDNA